MTTTFDRYRFAQVLLDGGEPLEALALLQPVEEEIDGNAAALLLLGRAYFHSAQLGRAREAFARVVALDPTDTYARFLLGRALERQSRLGEAQVQYRVAVAMSDRPEYRERLDEVTGRLEPDGN
ncbi:tetratricopeptide repeat protein [Pseudonocardia sichuanensis]